ncbi:MAG: hypothetical protein Q8K96_01125 [Rubrivivax sp.]|nr:hypothetical protein [Rubrivivax sp.]
MITPGPAGASAPAPRRGSSLALGWLGALLLAALGAVAHAAWGRAGAEARVLQARALVRALDLTDLAWFTEARYTRHLSQADLHSAFQDAPASLEHFPAGSLLRPALRYPPSGFTQAPAPR